MRLEHHVHGLDAGRSNHLEHARQVVGVRGHEGLAGRPPARHVHERVRGGHRVPNPAHRLHPARRRAPERHVKDRDALGRQPLEQRGHERQPLFGRQPLQDEIARDEVERAAVRKELRGRLEFHIRHAMPLGFLPGGREHRGRPIDRGHRAGVPGRAARQRNGEAADAAAVLEDRARVEIRAELQLDGAEHRRDERIAALEERALPFGGEVLAKELRRGENREIRLASREALPAWIRVVRHLDFVHHKGQGYGLMYTRAIRSPTCSDSTTSCPCVTWPKTAYCPSRSGRFVSVT